MTCQHEALIAPPDSEISAGVAEVAEIREDILLWTQVEAERQQHNSPVVVLISVKLSLTHSREKIILWQH